MNYQALYRKYRPKTFSEIIGQSNIVTILRNSIIKQSFSHAYLFSGSKGVGKTSTAKILAKTINCQNNINGESCNECINCQFIINNSEMDILEIDGASNNGVEEIRKIRNNINLLPMNLKYKVYIIDEVHMLTTSAFNALLKTLEEPPNHIVFIFATTEPYKIPDTIISRCQWFQFEKINKNDLVKIFEEILIKEKITFEIAALDQLAFLCHGSLRDGINSLEKVFNFSNNITLKSVNEIYNVITLEQKINFLINILNQDFNKIVLNIKQFNNYLNDFKKFLIEMISIVQDLLIYRLTKNIKISKFLQLETVNLFDSVSDQDLKLILNLFEEVIILNFDDENLKILLITKILNLFDNFSKYQLNNQKLFEVAKVAAESTEVQKQITIKSEVINEKKQLVILQQTQETNKEKLQEKKIVKSVINEVHETHNDIAVNQKLIDDILNVIVQADKEIRKELKQYWLKISQLTENYKFHNFSKVYLNTFISAASANAIVVICDNIIQANLINKSFSYQEHRNFLNFVLKKEYMVYALDHKEWKVIGKKYQSLLKQNKLPSPKPIIFPKAILKEKTQSKSKTLTFLKNIFGEIEEI